MGHSRRTVGALAGALLLTGLPAGCGTPRNYPDTAHFGVDEPTALYDQAIRVKITDMRAWTKVTVSARAEGAKSTWRSSAVFHADGHGVVDLTRDRPLSGSYGRKADGMGLFWSMLAKKGGPEYFWPGHGTSIRRTRCGSASRATASSWHTAP